MPSIHGIHVSRTTNYARDLDLNLLRVFVVVAETGSVTAAAARLYLTQPAVSAALKRLSTSLGAPLFARQGRSLVLTARGELLLREAKPHLEALIGAAMASPAFDPQESDRIVRLGLADSNERAFLPPLSRILAREAPRMRLVITAVQFRTVAAAFSSGAIDLAITVADELPRGLVRTPLFFGGFVALFDPRHARLGARPSLARYLAHPHVIVSYNGDLRGVVEDVLGVERRVRLSLPTFHAVGAILEGTDLVATLPAAVARVLQRERRHLATAKLPFALQGSSMDLLHREAQASDPALLFMRRHLIAIAQTLGRSRGRAEDP